MIFFSGIQDEKIKVLETFGHTNCSLSFAFDNILFSGDFLFENSIGNTIYPTANKEDMIKSYMKILSYKDYFKRCYCGHNSSFEFSKGLISEENFNFLINL